MLRKMFKLIYPIFCIINMSYEYRILGVFPMGARSHYFLGNRLMKGLAEAGHDVTLISPFRDGDGPPKNGKWREIVLDSLLDAQKERLTHVQITNKISLTPSKIIFLLNDLGKLVAEETLNHAKVKELMNSGETFDVVIVAEFVIDALKALAHHFNAHQVIFNNHAASFWVNHLVGNPSLPSFAPDVLFDLPPRMTFPQRLQNTLIQLLMTINSHFLAYPQQNQLIKKYVSPDLDIHDILYNVSLILINTHVSLNPPQATVPCMIEIGGFHVKPVKKLPEDLQIFLDNAKEGVIYFSMGSNLKSADLQEDKREGILRAFAKRKEKVLWKWENDVLPGQPSNVKLGKWLPQQDILAHPNVKAFITHGGYLSITETVYNGVPVIAIPILADQQWNAQTAKRAGFGIVLDFDELSERTMGSALEEILGNPKYSEHVKERSKIMHDRPVKPLDNAIYWIEYIVRHNGAKHLRVAYLDMPWYQYYLLDVLAFIFVIILIVSVTFVKIVLFICKRKKNEKMKTS